jgi:hypothetical protein
VPDPVIVPLLDAGDAEALRALTLQEISQTITPDKVNGYVRGLFNGHRALHVRDLPSDLFDDLPWFIYVVAYGNHPDTEYGLEPLPGEPVKVGAYRVRPFQLVKSTLDRGLPGPTSRA